MTTKAKQVHEQGPGETLNHGVSFKGRMRAGILLTGTPTVTITPSAGVTISNKQRNTTEITLDGEVCAADEAVLFTVSGLTLGVNYEIVASCGSTGSPAQVFVGTLDLRCRA